MKKLMYNAIIVSAIGSVLILGIPFLIDRAFLPTITGTGIVAERNFDREHFEPNPDHFKMPLVQSVHYDDKWSIKVDINGSPAEKEVSYQYYDSIKLFQPVKLKYTKSRIWGKLKIKELL